MHCLYSWLDRYYCVPPAPNSSKAALAKPPEPKKQEKEVKQEGAAPNISGTPPVKPQEFKKMRREKSKDMENRLSKQYLTYQKQRKEWEIFSVVVSEQRLGEEGEEVTKREDERKAISTTSDEHLRAKYHDILKDGL
jgi:hypothetical protein